MTVKDKFFLTTYNYRKMAKINIVIFDVETGGLVAKENPITQIALQTVSIDNWEEVARWESYVKPYGEYQLTQGGLDASMVSKKQLMLAPDSKEVFKVLIEYFKKSKPTTRKKPILAGHNVDFDIAFLNEFFSFHGKKLSDYVHTNNDEISRWDTLRLAEAAFGSKKDDDEDMKLKTCCKRAGIELFDAHGAMADVLATSKLLNFFIGRLRQVGEKSTVNSRKSGEEGKLRHNTEKPFQF